MSPHKGRALRVFVLIFIDLILLAALAACGVFFYTAYRAIHTHAPMELFGYAPVEVAANIGELDAGDLLIVEGASGNSFALSAKGGLYLAESDGLLYRVSDFAEQTEASANLLLEIDDAAPVLRFALTPERLLVLLIIVLLGAVLLELVLCLLLFRRKKTRRKKKNDEEFDELSELDKYAELDYNPFPQKLYSSKVEMIEIEDDPEPVFRSNVAIKVGKNPVKVFPLIGEAEFSDEEDGYRITLSIKKL